MTRATLEDNFISITHNLNEIEELKLETIPGELQEVIINLINNSKDAIKYNNIQNGIINISIYKEADLIVIKVSDNGGGIPDSILPRIFEPFFTTKHAFEGTGLGLHMSYRVVTESLNGKIYAENGLHGAIFYIKLQS